MVDETSRSPAPARAPEGAAVELAANRYGKDGIRLAVVTRGTDRHAFTDLEIAVRFEGAFEAAHEVGDNRAVLPTDTMRGTCYALAREHGVTSPAAFGRLLAARFLEAAPAVHLVRVELLAHPWEPVAVAGEPHPHAFRPASSGTGVTVVTQRRDEHATVTGGVRGLRLLKTTGSAFVEFLRDPYTTLAEAEDRILATTVEAAWGYTTPDVDHARVDAAVPDTFASRFATHDTSASMQHTLHAMGTAVLDAHPDVAWIRFSLPNQHHVLADLSAYGLDNPNEVFVVTDRPYGVIEGTVTRAGFAPEPEQQP